MKLFLIILFASVVTSYAQSLGSASLGQSSFVSDQIEQGAGSLLLEGGGNLLLESGGKLLLENI